MVLSKRLTSTFLLNVSSVETHSFASSNSETGNNHLNDNFFNELFGILGFSSVVTTLTKVVKSEMLMVKNKSRDVGPSVNTSVILRIWVIN